MDQLSGNNNKIVIILKPICLPPLSIGPGCDPFFGFLFYFSVMSKYDSVIVWIPAF